MPVPATTTSSVEVARAFADAYAGGDAAGVAERLAPDVREREIVPGTVVDQQGREAVVAELEAFLRPFGAPEILRNEVEPFGPLVRWSTRWRLHRDAERLLVEWHAFLTVQDGLVTRLDVVCSGVVAEPAE